jgi:hypothetical protein
MANLTYRSVKGSPLTNDELDNNFSYFTGSHTITGSLTTTEGIVTSGSILISGSIIPNVAPGNLTSSFDLGSPTAAWKDIYVSEGSIKFIASGSQTVISATPTGISVNGGPTLTGGGFSGSVSNTGSVSTSGSVNTTGSVNTSGSVNTTGSVSTSGSVNTIGSSNTTGSSNTSGSVNTTGSVNTSGSVNTVGTTSTTGSSTISGSFSSVGNSTFTGSVAITGSPVIAGNLTVSGSLIVSGSNTIVNIGSLTTGDAANIAKNNSTAQGEGTLASGSFTHAEGSYSVALGYASHAEGTSNTGLYAWDTTSTTNGLIQLATSVGNITSSFPNGTPILLDNSGTIYKYAVSNSFFAASRTQIQLTNTSVNYGSAATISLYSQISSPSTQLTNQTQILGGNTAHSEGYSTIALGSYSHAEGELNTALGYASHVEGNGTISQGDYQHVQGLYNITSSTAGAFILGNGTDDSNRKNLIFASGNSVQISGSILVSGSIVPNVPAGSSTSSFSLGSPTNAWKDIYVSNGTINFLNSAGQVQGTIGAGTNATVITGSLVTTPVNPLTDFALFSTTIQKSYTNSDCAFSLANSSFQYTRNPEIYTNGSVMVLPWDRKITAYSLVNNCLTAAQFSPNPVVSLPPVYNAGYTSGDIITVYNMGEVGSFYRASGSIYITATVSGVTQVDTNNKLITATFNTSYIISGSWGNYTNLSSIIPATTHSIKIDPGQKATFEVVYWGSSTPGPSASISEFPEIGYKTNMTNVSPSFTYLVYKFKGIENL